jgi:hypothetical protein
MPAPRNEPTTETKPAITHPQYEAMNRSRPATHRRRSGGRPAGSGQQGRAGTAKSHNLKKEKN